MGLRSTIWLIALTLIFFAIFGRMLATVSRGANLNEPVNLIENGSFDEDLSGWIWTESIDDQPPVYDSATNGMHMPMSSVFQYDINVIDGGVYDFSFLCAAFDSSQTAEVIYGLVDARIDTVEDPIHISFSGTNLQVVSCGSTAETVSKRVALTNGNHKLVFYATNLLLDDVQLIQVPDQEDIDTGLIKNGDFFGFEGWGREGQIQSFDSYNGATTQGAASISATQNGIMVETAGVYELSVFCGYDSLDTNRNADIIYLLGKQNENGESNYDYVAGLTETVKCADKMERFKVFLEPGSHTLFMVANSNNGAVRDYYSFLDDISLFEVNDATDIDTGLIENGDFWGRSGWDISDTNVEFIPMNGKSAPGSISVRSALSPDETSGQLSQPLQIPIAGKHRFGFFCELNRFEAAILKATFKETASGDKTDFVVDDCGSGDMAFDVQLKSGSYELVFTSEYDALIDDVSLVLTDADPTPTFTPTPTLTATATETPTATSTPTVTPTVTSTSTPDPTATPTQTATQTATLTPSPTQTEIADPKPSQTPTEMVTLQPSATPSATVTPSSSLVPSMTPVPTETIASQPPTAACQSLSARENCFQLFISLLMN